MSKPFVGRSKKLPRRPLPDEVSEKAMAKLILQLGTLKARELIDRTEAILTRSLGL